MSSVRMCDKCGTIFSELSMGWQSYSASEVIEDADGFQRLKTVHMDACAECSIPMRGRQMPKPRLALESGNDE